MVLPARGGGGGGGEDGHFHSKVIGMLVIFSGYKILILVFFRVFSVDILCRNEILVFLGCVHFPCRVKMRSFQKVFSNIGTF